MDPAPRLQLVQPAPLGVDPWIAIEMVTVDQHVQELTRQLQMPDGSSRIAAVEQRLASIEAQLKTRNQRKR